MSQAKEFPKPLYCQQVCGAPQGTLGCPGGCLVAHWRDIGHTHGPGDWAAYTITPHNQPKKH